MRPISVLEPVAATSPRAVPCVTSVPDHSIDLRSPSGAAAATGSGVFSTATDSPVSIASCAASPRASISRRSAGTLSPASSSTMSPGTRLAPSTDWRCPSRRTAARGASMPRIAAMAVSALPSWTKPIPAVARTTARMTPVAIQWFRNAVTTAAASRTWISTLLNWARNRKSGPRDFASGRRFGPWAASRSSASDVVRPARRASRSARQSAAGRECGSETRISMPSAGYQWPR